MYVDQCNRVNCLIYESKMKYYSSAIEENSSNQFELFRAVEKMLYLKAPPCLPMIVRRILQIVFQISLQKKYKPLEMALLHL